jgi:5-methylcytosine-specific restriction endonuclease McrA
MNEVANKLITLSLNSAWKPIGYKTVKDAIISLTGSETKPEPNSLAIDIEYSTNNDGTPNFADVVNMRPVAWSEWITLPIREWDITINGSNRAYRVPTVIVAINYDKMPRKAFDGKPSKDSIFSRDNYTCQVTGQKLPREMLTVDHVVPRSRGGSDGWDNLTTMRKDINTKKGNKMNSEAGIKLMRQPFKPNPIDVMYLIREARHQDWKHFLVKE